MKPKVRFPTYGNNCNSMAVCFKFYSHCKSLTLSLQSFGAPLFLSISFASRQSVDVLSCTVNMKTHCCNQKDSSPQVCITPPSTQELAICLFPMVYLHSGCLGLGWGRGNKQQALHCPSLCLFRSSLSCSLLQFSRCPGYLCHGNCASLPAQTPLVSLFASLMTQQLLQSFQPPPCSTWRYNMLIRQRGVLSSSPSSLT